MQIQKGLVKYKDRSDIVCTYGVTEDGRQYYFLDGGSLANGNAIASTVLVEAIDPVVVATSVGVVDPSGNVVIPFENKSIKVITENLLLVERSNSTSPSVIEALNLRSDPLAATKLVTTPATIKDNMNAKMGAEGRFVFNDQFSDATICDINGNNLVNNEYYSFIGIKNNDALFFSKNTVDSPVDEFSLVEKSFVVPPVAENADKLDVVETAVTMDTIDGAMAAQEQSASFGEEDITAKDFEAQSQDVSEGNNLEENSTMNEESTENSETTETTVVNNDETNAENDINSGEEALSVMPEVKEETSVGDSEVSGNETSDETQNATEDGGLESDMDDAFNKALEETASVESTSDSVSTKEEVDGVNSENVSEVDNKQSEEVQSKEDELVPFDFGDNINYSANEEVENDLFANDTANSYEKNDLFEVDLDTDIFADSVLHADKIDIDDNFGDFNYRGTIGKDTIIEDVATTMSNLISLNRNQKQKIVNYEEKFAQAAATHKKVVEKVKSQIKDIEVLKAKLKNYDTIVAKLEAKVQSLENKVHDQDKVINSQMRELESLRPQVEGKEELVKILADAQNLLDQAM